MERALAAPVPMAKAQPSPADLARVVRDLGFPIVVALVLLYSTLVQSPRDVDRIVTRLESLERSETAKDAQMVAALTRLVDQIEVLLKR